MIVSHVNLVIGFSTSPQVRSIARVHAGSFSEGFWWNGSIGANSPAITAWAQLRANFLPTTCTVIGVRIAQYNLSVNKLTPTGTQSGRLFFAGNAAFTINAPQDSFSIYWTSNNVANTSKTAHRCWPDELAVAGEVAGAALRGVIGNYTAAIIANPWGFLGRNLQAPSADVQSIAANVITVNAVPGLFNPPPQPYRLVRVYGSDQRVITAEGTITAINGNALTVTGLPAGATVTKPSGIIRLDQTNFFLINGSELGRLGVKKVGKDTEQYRGRRSKRVTA